MVTALGNTHQEHYGDTLYSEIFPTMLWGTNLAKVWGRHRKRQDRDIQDDRVSSIL